MKTKLHETLILLGSYQLGVIIGDQTERLIAALGEDNLRVGSLANLIIELHGPLEILFRPDIRKLLLSRLGDDDKEILCSILNLSSVDQLLNISIRGKRNRKLGELLEFFGHPDAIPKEAPGTPEPTENLDVDVVNYPLFDHQRRAAKRVIKLIDSDLDNPRVMLHMPTGSGKTRTAMHCINRYINESIEDPLVVWLAHTEELCEQAFDEFKKSWSFLGNRPFQVHRAFGNSSQSLESVHSGFLSSSIQSMYQKLNSNSEGFSEFMERVDLVIMDEAHMAIARTYDLVLSSLAFRQGVSLLGLSATPGRFEQESSENLAKFFEYNLVQLEIDGRGGINPVEYLQEEGYLAKVNYKYVDWTDDVSITPGELDKLRSGLGFNSNFIKKLEESEIRNLEIINEIIEQYNEGKKIVVFACSVDHSNLLSSLLNLKKVPSASITSETDLEYRRHKIHDFKKIDGETKVLCNYGILTAGFDAPTANCAIIARPTDSVVMYSQMVGRVARGQKQGGSEECLVVTVNDPIEGFKSIASGFQHWDENWEPLW